MATAPKPRGRARGAIETLPSGSLRVKVYTGLDPLMKKEHYLVQTVPAGPGARREAENVRAKLLSQLDEQPNPRTRATVDQLLDRWLDVVELEAATRRNYVSKLTSTFGRSWVGCP
jgi:integrase